MIRLLFDKTHQWWQCWPTSPSNCPWVRVYESTLFKIYTHPNSIFTGVDSISTWYLSVLAQWFRVVLLTAVVAPLDPSHPHMAQHRLQMTASPSIATCTFVNGFFHESTTLTMCSGPKAPDLGITGAGASGSYWYSSGPPRSSTMLLKALLEAKDLHLRTAV